MYNVPLNRINESMMVYPVKRILGLCDEFGYKKELLTWNVLDEEGPGVFPRPFHLLGVYTGRDIVE